LAAILSSARVFGWPKALPHRQRSPWKNPNWRSVIR